MKKKSISSIKLGVFVLAGLFFLILLLYMIGKNKDLFGSAFIIKARFDNVQGLVAGNNVRYAGIEIGTVKKINILNDTMVEVTMKVEDVMNQVIRTNAIASIGTDGLMGNKVINIAPGQGTASLIKENDILATHIAIDMDKMLNTLNRTNNDVSVIADNLKNIVIRVNSSTALWQVLNDQDMPGHLKTSAANIRLATTRAAAMALDLQILIGDIKNGKGSLGAILTDSLFAKNLNEAVWKIQMVGEHADTLMAAIQSAVVDIQHEVTDGKGTVHALLKDSALTQKLNNSLENIEKGTDAFNQNMEALKHNFLFRGYFRKLEKQKPTRQKVAIH